MFSHDISLDTNAWETAQPQSLGKPLDEFWAERFLVPNRTKKSVDPREKFEPGHMGTLIREMTTCDQVSRFVTDFKLATVAIMLAEFEIQLCDPEQVDAAIPPVGLLAYGTVKPLEKLAVRIRKRRT